MLSEPRKLPISTIITLIYIVNKEHIVLAVGLVSVYHTVWTLVRTGTTTALIVAPFWVPTPVKLLLK